MWGEGFAQKELDYINEPFDKYDLIYLDEINTEKYWYKKYFIKI